MFLMSYDPDAPKWNIAQSEQQAQPLDTTSIQFKPKPEEFPRHFVNKALIYWYKPETKQHSK